MTKNGSSDQGGNLGSDSGPKTPPTTPRKVLKGALWRKRKRTLVERRSAMESSGLEPDAKKSRKSRKTIAATSKFFWGVKGKGDNAKKKLVKIEKEPDDSVYSPSSDSGTDSDDSLEDWSPEEKEEEEVSDSVHGNLETFRNLGNFPISLRNKTIAGRLFCALVRLYSHWQYLTSLVAADHANYKSSIFEYVLILIQESMRIFFSWRLTVWTCTGWS